jgi:thiol-disulfide isomerase/thioredoxin
MSVLTISAAALVALSTTAAPLGPEVKLEGKGEVRSKLDAMSYKPLDPAVLGALSEWAGGDALTVDSLKGKPVVFVTWSSWYKTSHEALRVAQALNGSFGDKGLVVIGVHHPHGYEKAAEVVTAAGAAFPYALDSKGEFRKAFSSNQDPDFYLVDRAGNLRFADVETSSVEAAARMLVDETPEQAAKAQPAAAEEAKPAAAGNGEGDSKYTKPDAAAYKAAKWPKHNGNLSAANFQGKPLPKPLGKEKYLASKGPDLAGKVTVLDFWATWCPPCRAAMPNLDKLQKDNADLVIIGISDESESVVKSYLTKHKHAYAQATDGTKTVSNALKIQGIPHVVVLSSDGVIRWQGNPLQPEFEPAVKSVVEADPGVKARREASK